MVFVFNETEKLRRAVAARAKHKRVQMGITVQALADHMGRTRQCLFGMEQEGTDSLRVIQDWAMALDCTPEWLTFGDERMEARGKLLLRAARNIDARTGPRKELVRRIKEEVRGPKSKPALDKT
jgi:hypothetical protein